MWFIIPIPQEYLCIKSIPILLNCLHCHFVSSYFPTTTVPHLFPYMVCIIWLFRKVRKTAVTHASEKGHTAIVELLIQAVWHVFIEADESKLSLCLMKHLYVFIEADKFKLSLCLMKHFFYPIILQFRTSAPCHVNFFFSNVLLYSFRFKDGFDSYNACPEVRPRYNCKASSWSGR